MKDPKKTVIGIFVIFLFVSLAVMTYLLANESSPLSLFNLRASNTADEIDPFLADLDISPVRPVSPTVTSGSGLLTYNSTSPTVTPVVSKTQLTSSPALSPSVSLTPPPTEFVVITGNNLTPTIVTELPVSGATDHIWTFLVGGGVLILLAFFL